jgi:hypothetical protein
MRITYDKPSADSDCKVRALRALFEAYGPRRAALDAPLDALKVRGHWGGGWSDRNTYTGYDYDLQSWIEVDTNPL